MVDLRDKYYARPYIGVCDVPSAEAVAQYAQKFSIFAPLALKAGITMTRKALWGIPTKWSTVCPPLESIASIFAKNDARAVYRVVHYADYDGVDLAPSLEKIITSAGPNLAGVQLDMIWPDPRVLEETKKKYPHITFILQIGTNALTKVDNNPAKMWAFAGNYVGVVDRFLLDKSMGKGRLLEARELVRFVDILYEQMKEPGVVVAGKLGPDTLESVRPLIAMYPHLSIDAQSGLRESGNTLDGGIAPLRVNAYLERAIAMHKEYNKPE